MALCLGPRVMSLEDTVSRMMSLDGTVYRMMSLDGTVLGDES